MCQKDFVYFPLWRLDDSGKGGIIDDVSNNIVGLLRNASIDRFSFAIFPQQTDVVFIIL